ncbi:hypothetical protein [Enterovibrio norvegicus]|uniref:hypothetical protein n=1 Tax=Enterovibrio norvegicus TaxID=188144 RepID=UPI00354FA896
MSESTLVDVKVLPDTNVILNVLSEVHPPTFCDNAIASASIDINGQSFSIFIQEGAVSLTLCKSYDASSGAYFVDDKTITLEHPVETLKGFYFGGQPWLICYHSDSEYAQCYRINTTELTLENRVATRVGAGFTTITPLYYRNDVFFVAYNKNTGAVAKYQMMSPAYSPLYCQVSWSATWAQGWTRFAFFRLGGENFFIKTNEKYNKVNIDHFMDSIDLGSHPVLNESATPLMLGLSDVQTFYDSNNTPYFYTYQPDGSMTFNRFDGDCNGWKVALTCQQAANSSLRHTVQLPDRTLILLSQNS